MMTTTTSLPAEFVPIARNLRPLARGFRGAYGLLDDDAGQPVVSAAESETHFGGRV
jgi:hypothetical protein